MKTAMLGGLTLLTILFIIQLYILSPLISMISAVMFGAANIQLWRMILNHDDEDIEGND